MKRRFKLYSMKLSDGVSESNTGAPRKTGVIFVVITFREPVVLGVKITSVSISLKSLQLNVLLIWKVETIQMFFYFIAFVVLGICFALNLNYVSLHLRSVIELTL